MPPPEPQAVIDAVVALLGREHVLDGAEAKPYAVDGVTPAAVARPPTVEALAATLAEASRLGAAVIPWGGGTAMALGNLPEAYDLALDTRSLDRTVEYEPGDLTITAEAGITLAKLEQTLAAHGQFFPLDPPGWREATLGGVLASGVIGPWRHAYGPARDWVLGLRVAHAGGRLSRGGGRVVKNVAGYDMPKLYLGSLGTLGVIVEASLKVTPRPSAEATWLAACPSMAEAVSLALEAHGKGLRLRALAVLRNDAALAGAEDGGPTVAAWVGGSEAAVERSLRELDGLAAAAGLAPTRRDADACGAWWESVRALCRRAEGSQAVVRASYLPSQAAAFLEDIEALHPLAVAAYPAAGIAYARFSGVELWARAVGQLRHGRIGEVGGSVVVEACERSLKERLDVFGEPQEDFPIMQRLREQMDPQRVLNRGRFLGRL